MQAQNEAPPDMQCKDKFLLQSVVAGPGASAKDITPELFSKESGNHIEECKLKVSYVPPLRAPSPVQECSDEGSSPRASVSDNGTVASEYDMNSWVHVEPQDNTSEVVISRMNTIIQQSNRLERELDLLWEQERNILYTIIVGIVLLGWLVPYLVIF